MKHLEIVVMTWCVCNSPKFMPDGEGSLRPHGTLKSDWCQQGPLSAITESGQYGAPYQIMARVVDGASS